eukprot:TRINITY_DN27829_c1_g1_i1.p1 TRINITY_DN27829_c1_g1~~TRINITY_DN27829_c1_g1_i1.p1  ORF type:complete len:141 (-),score=21.82 TRINITY_DN27829_c1_g1_i1:240-662(-)
MDPITYDRWWRKRVQKEEYDQVKHLINPPPSHPSLLLNPLGAPQLFSYATEDKARDYVMSTQPGSSYKSSIKSSHNGSPTVTTELSYPKTPNFSETGTSLASTEVMRRLSVLEQELSEEKEKRVVVEKQMNQLLARVKPN